MRTAIALAAILSSLPLLAQEQDSFPPLQVRAKIEIDDHYVTLNLYETIADIRLKYNPAERFTDRIDMTFRVIGDEKSCLHKTFLLGVSAIPQLLADNSWYLSRQYIRSEEFYFEIHYLTSHNSIRGLIPLMTESGGKKLRPGVEIERFQLAGNDRTELLLQGFLNSEQRDLGFGICRHFGHNLAIKVMSNRPAISLVFTFDLSNLLEK